MTKGRRVTAARLAGILLAPVALGWALIGCAREESPAGPVPSPQPVAEAVDAAPLAEEAPAVDSPAAPETPAGAPPITLAAGAAPSTAHAEPDPGDTAVSAPSDEARVPLEVLLQTPSALGPPQRAPLDLESLRYEPLPATPTSPSALDEWKSRLRLESRSEPIGPAGPRQGTVSETDAKLRVPLDGSVSLEGGIRLDQRDEPGADEPERKSTPRVGVEVRF